MRISASKGWLSENRTLLDVKEVILALQLTCEEQKVYIQLHDIDHVGDVIEPVWMRLGEEVRQDQHL